jgi:hypothetical protein
VSEVVSIIGGGWSFREVDHSKIPGLIIAVNDGLVYLERRPDCVLSMDRVWTEQRWEQIKTACAQTYIRRNVLKNVRPDPSWTWFHQFENNNDGRALSPDDTVLNGANSGACAVNLAYCLRPKHLYLFGFDMCLSPDGKSHWYPQYSWAKKQGSGYNAWPHDFNLYAQQFKAAGVHVVNVSKYSRIIAFPKVSARELGVGR